MRRGHGVGGVRQRSVDRAGDFAGASVNGEVAGQRGGDRPNGRTVVERWMEADGVDGLVLENRVRIVRVHTEVQFVRGRITALVGVNRVGLILGVDRRCATNRTARDAHAGWQSRVCPPCDGGRGRVPGIVSMRRNGQRLMCPTTTIARSVSEPQLSVAVAPPAHHGTVVNNGAGVPISPSYGDSRPAYAEVNRCGWR